MTDDAFDPDDLRALIKRVRQVELRSKRAVNAHAQGAYHSRFKGRGMAFDESRTYVPGDDPRHIDWNVTARTGELFVKQYIEERELTLLIAVDVSGSLHFGTEGAHKRQRAAEVAAVMAFSALRNNDKVGLLLFTDKIERLIRPRKGRGHVLRILREVLATRPQGRGTDVAAAFTTVTHLSRQRAIVAFITDLIPAPGEVAVGDGGTWERPLKVLQKRHDLMVIELEDRLEHTLPDVGLLAIEDPETGAQHVIDTSLAEVRDAFAEKAQAQKDEIRARLRRLGVEHLPLASGDDPSVALVRFLRRRARSAA